MFNSRRLPPHLRMVRLLGLLFPIAAVPVLIAAFISKQSSAPPSMVSLRLLIIAVNLIMLGLACSYAMLCYRLRFRHQEHGPFPPAPWQSHVWVIALLTALALAALVLPFISTFSITIVFLPLAIGSVAAVVLLAAYL